MKLYTEEQVIRAIELSFGRSEDEVLAGLTPIELPSDEEIYQAEPKECSGDFDLGVMNGFRKGAKWMRDKIGGNNEQTK
jgi:hypothetical protein